ncbi:N-acetylmuramoyl-L-alanine amidase [Flavobacterium sp. ST-87]|uniref:N-acetylmuramoyl-L-alanine amidase n=1 Tax=Flavobacterium plantiphilum TaxID=3163297 RepID=A0ABW8XNF9_9FLAO
MKFNSRNFFFITILMLSGFSSVFSQNNKVFTIILDAGHGGKDPGNSYHGFVEKKIALKTVLKIGDFLEKEKGIKVIYTRTSDVFVELADRPKVANNAKADLFVSVHCNSVKNEGPHGTETFVMGLSRYDMNLEVAKNENSVILLEKDYKTKYQGFDPKKPETLIGLTMVQEENLNNSISLASGIQNNFTKKLKRNSRGVKQQPLWVLDAAYMPSVLIELGFLSNKTEGEFLNSEEGQTKMAKQIADAILNYKRQNYGTAESAYTANDKTADKKDADLSADLYKIQLLASSRKIKLEPGNFKGLKNVSYEFSNKLYKYMFGATSDFAEAKKKQLEARNAGYLKAFIVRVKK